VARRRLRPSTIPEWSVAFDPDAELDWGRSEYGRRLLREHLDQSHESASRTQATVDAHVRRLSKLLPRPPACLLDAGCGPGLYASRLAALGYDVMGVDIGEAVLRHAKQEARSRHLEGRVRYRRTDLRQLRFPAESFDAALLIYFTLEAFPRTEQHRVLQRIAATLVAGGWLIAELRLRPDQPPGRTTWWDVVPNSLLSDQRHLLLGDANYDPRRHTYVFREVAVFDDGTVEIQQTSGWLCPYDGIARHFERGGFDVSALYDGWTNERATGLSETLLVVARRAA
jgi:SAM-dependent methyltransferase